MWNGTEESICRTGIEIQTGIENRYMGPGGKGKGGKNWDRHIHYHVVTDNQWELLKSTGSAAQSSTSLDGMQVECEVQE